MIQWKMTMSICGSSGCEMHYAGEYNGTKVQFVRVPKGVSKSGETRIFVVQDEPWHTRTEFRSEKELVKYMDANYPPNSVMSGKINSIQSEEIPPIADGSVNTPANSTPNKSKDGN